MYDVGDGPSLPILVDDFKHASGVSSYFLTHLHADHTRGLCKNWNNGFIYCSEVTMRLFNHKFKDLCISSRLLHSLELGVPHALQLSNSMPATVTFVDANHCPGAVMLVIEVQGRCIVHTGERAWPFFLVFWAKPYTPFFWTARTRSPNSHFRPEKKPPRESCHWLASMRITSFT